MLTYTATVRKSQDRCAVDQEQGGPEEATQRAEDRTGPIARPKDRRRFRIQAHKDVRHPALLPYPRNSRSVFKAAGTDMI